MKVVKKKKNFKVGDKILIDCENGVMHGLVWREEHEPTVVLLCDKNWKILNTKGARLSDLQAISQVANIEKYGVDFVIYLDSKDKPLTAVEIIVSCSREIKSKWIVGQIVFTDGTSQYVWCDKGEILNVSDSLTGLFDPEEDEDPDECFPEDAEENEEEGKCDCCEENCDSKEEECDPANCFSFPGCGSDGCCTDLSSVPPCKAVAPSTTDIMARCDFIETLMVNAFEKLEMAALERINEIDSKVDKLVKKLDCKCDKTHKCCSGKCCKRGKRK